MPFARAKSKAHAALAPQLIPDVRRCLMRQREIDDSIETSRRDLGSPVFGPVAIAILVLHFGLFFFVIALIFLAYGLPGLRAAWNTELPLGLTTHSSFELIVLLFAVLILFEAFVWRRNRRSAPLGVWGYGASFVFTVSLGVGLYMLEAGPLDDDWYQAAVEGEEHFPHYSFIGRVIGEDATGCRPEGTTCLRVELESGDIVSAELVDVSDQYPARVRHYKRDEDGNPYYEVEVLEEPGPATIVYVVEMVGQFSERSYYKATFPDLSTFPDPELFWRDSQRLAR